MSALRGASGLTSAPAAGVMAAADANAGVRPMPAGDPQQVLFHFDLLRSLRMHKRLAIGVFILALLAAAAYLVKGWNSYTAQAVVYVQPAPSRLLQTGPENRWPYDANTYDTYIQQQIHNVTRPDVLATAVQRIPGWQRSGENIQLAVVRLNRSLEVARVGTSYQISITSKAKSAEKAAQVANAAAASFIESAAREQHAGDDQRIQLLREERDRVQTEMAADRAEQDDLNKKLGVASIGGVVPDPIDQQIDAVRSELTKARADNDEAAARLMTTDKGGAAASAAMDAEADDLVAADPGMVSMKTALNGRRSQLISQMANLTPNHPQYKQDEEELAKINTSLDSMTKELRTKAAAHIQQKLKNDLERTSAVEGKLNAQLAQLTAVAGTAGPRLQRLNELSADIQRLQNRFALVDEQFRNLTLENNAPGGVYLADAAVAPLGASRDLVLRNALVIVLAGLLLGWGGAILAHNLDKHIYIAADVERVLGFTPMAQLPDFSEVGPGVEEEYLLRLAAALEHAHQQGALKSCVFTGVAPGAGATTVATRITSMLEAMGRDTVLVDASGSPAPPPVPEGSPEAGTELVPAQKGSRPTALLQQMAEETGEDTIVLSDTAPLLVSGETEYLARFVDSAIVVIESGVTTKAQLRDVAHTLQRLEVSAVGFVLNRIAMEKANPSFRDSVRAVERHLNGDKPNRAPQESKSKPANRTKKNAPKGGGTEPPQGSHKNPAAEAPPSFNRIVTPEPAATAAAERPIEVPPITPVADRPPIPKSVTDPTVSRYVDRVVRDPFADQVEPEPLPDPLEDRAYTAPLRGRPLRQATPSPAPAPAVVAEASVPPPAPRAEPAPVSVSDAPAQPVAAPVPQAATTSPEPAPDAASIPAPVPEAVMVASANPAAINEVALQARSSGPEGDLHEAGYHAATRLGGLRNLFASLGLKTANREGEFSEADAPAEPRYERVERPAERPVYAEPIAPIATAAAARVPGADPVEVVAQPEFLPPKPMVETMEKEPEKETRPPAPPRKNRWDSSEDIETLPSWRGQYRKKR